MESELRNLHTQLLNAWNAGDARGFAALFAPQGICIGFDGTEYTSASEVEAQLGTIFKDHTVEPYVAKIREVKFLDERTAILRAAVSMTPPDSRQIKPDRNAQQILVARKEESWQIASLQNTPARFDGRPEAVQAMTEEMQAVADQLPEERTKNS